MSVKAYTSIIDDLIEKSGLSPAEIEQDDDRINSIIDAAISQYYLHLIPAPTLDINGHNATIPEKYRTRLTYQYCSDILNLHGYHYFSTLVSTEPNYMTFEERIDFSTTSSSCCVCDAHMGLKYDYDTKTVSLTERSKKAGICPGKEIDPKHSMELDLSGGKILIANDMRCLFGEVDEEEAEFHKANESRTSSVNSMLGRINNTNFWASLGMMYFQSGNTCPSYFWNPDKHYFVFRDAFEDWEDYTDVEPKWDELPFTLDLEKEVDKGYVCTDLWAVNAMSMETFKALCAKNGFDEELMIRECSISIHDVTPGIYTCTTYYEMPNSESMKIYHSVQLKE